MPSEITAQALKVALKSIDEFASRELSDALLQELDEKDEFPAEIVHRMSSGDDLGIQLLFVPFEYGGMGGGAFDVYRICERVARIDLGLATAELATFLGSDPIRVGGTEDQKRKFIGRIASDGILFAYGATEPAAGSDLGSIKTTADRVMDNGTIKGYRINGAKQWISNGGVAELYTVLAMTDGGPTWFVVDRGTEGFTHGEPENKHGIRLSNTSALFLNNVYVDADRVIGGVEGKGLVQAQQVFGYTRLMVAAFGLGAGWAALDRAIPYSAKRIQAGGPLSEKTGYTYKLIVPHAIALEASRAAIEETADKLDSGAGPLNVDGAVAKYLATEAGDAAADAALQAHGGYGYTHDYVVEKIHRDVRITRIYEGTSEIMEMTISRGRWQENLKSGGQLYHERARSLEVLHAENPAVGADVAALTHHALAELLERCRAERLTRNQHVLLRLGALIAWTEGAASLARHAQRAATKKLDPKHGVRLRAQPLAAAARVNARNVALNVATEGIRLVAGSNATAADLPQRFDLVAIHAAQAGLMDDLAIVSDALYGRKR